MSTKLERQRELRLLRNQVQELREKVEPIRHSRKVARLVAEKEKLKNFLEGSNEKPSPIKAPNPTMVAEDAKMFSVCTWTHPYSEDCDCNLCHPENCECAMCNARSSSCACLECIQGHDAECTYLSANIPIKTEQLREEQVAASVETFLVEVDNFKRIDTFEEALEKAFQEGWQRKYDSSRHCDDCRKEQSDFDKTVDAIIANNEAVKAAAAPAPISGVDVSDLYGLHRLRDDEMILFLGEISIYKKGEPIKAAIRECECGNEALSQYETCLVCRTGVGKRNQETSLEIVPAVAEPINNTEHLNGECGNPDGCEYCISVG